MPAAVRVSAHRLENTPLAKVKIKTPQFLRKQGELRTILFPRRLRGGLGWGSDLSQGSHVQTHYHVSLQRIEMI